MSARLAADKGSASMVTILLIRGVAVSGGVQRPCPASLQAASASSRQLSGHRAAHQPELFLGHVQHFFG